MDMTAAASVAAGAAMGIFASAAALMVTVGLGCLPACMFTVSAISGAERSDSGGDGDAVDSKGSGGCDACSPGRAHKTQVGDCSSGAGSPLTGFSIIVGALNFGVGVSSIVGGLSWLQQSHLASPRAATRHVNGVRCS